MTTICALMVIKNGNYMGYPWLEALAAVLPSVNIFILQEGYSDKDDTFDWCVKLANVNPKFRIQRYEWPTGLPSGFAIGSATNRALSVVPGNCDWVWMVQADELWHDASVGGVRDLLMSDGTQRFQALSFNFLHLEHNCQVEQQGAGYQRAIRVIRNGQGIGSHRDAWTFEGALEELSVNMSHPIVHCNYCFWDNVPLKKRAQADLLYHDLGHYEKSANDAEAEYSALSGGVPEEFTRLSSPFTEHLPDHFKPLIGQRKYTPRLEVVEMMRGM